MFPERGDVGERRTIADGYLLVGMGSNQWGDISSLSTERVDTRAVSTTANITFLPQGYRTNDKEKGSEEKNSSTLVEKERRHRFGTRLQFLSFFSGGSFEPWEAHCLYFVFLSVCVLLLCSLIVVPFR